MLIKLTQHVMEGNNVKTTVRSNRNVVIPWVEGATLEASAATAAKLVKAGKARLLTEDEQAIELEKIGGAMRAANKKEFDDNKARVLRENKLLEKSPDA